ncbi:MAG TPA: YkvA family protein [Dehalococcoidia bacterium]|nr:YkvA family protein [Dehalococcoidia bacterium]
MSSAEWIVVILLSLLALAIVVYMLYRRFRVHPVLRHIQDLSWENRFRLAGRLLADEQIPLVNRAILVLIVVYLALPIDLIPDFIPVLGQIDDIVILGGGILLFARLVERERLESHIAELKREQDRIVDTEARLRDVPQLEAKLENDRNSGAHAPRGGKA